MRTLGKKLVKLYKKTPPRCSGGPSTAPVEYCRLPATVKIDCHIPGTGLISVAVPGAAILLIFLATACIPALSSHVDERHGTVLVPR